VAALAAGDGTVAPGDGLGEGALPICAPAAAATSDAMTTNEALFMMLLQKRGSV
jgi:hypothetical protein